MGGFVNGRKQSMAVKRELQEEMGIDIIKPPQLHRVYSDPRQATADIPAYQINALPSGDGEEKPVAADDVKR
jgi:ADP-ribose pyrophosphatase YjhB (NUDIX family)